VLAFMSFPKDHRPKIHSINPLERLNGEIKRRTPRPPEFDEAHKSVATGKIHHGL
jgi:transposase-like protein